VSLLVRSQRKGDFVPREDREERRGGHTDNTPKHKGPCIKLCVAGSSRILQPLRNKQEQAFRKLVERE